MSTEQSYLDFLNLVDLYIKSAEKNKSFPSSLHQAEELKLRNAVKAAIVSSRMLGAKLARITTPGKKAYHNHKSLFA